MDYKHFQELILEELAYLEELDIGENWDLMKASGALVTLLEYVEMQMKDEAQQADAKRNCAAMNSLDKARGELAIQQVAERQGISAEEVRREVQICIDAAWANADPAGKVFQDMVFPGGKPSPAEFIGVLRKQAQKNGQ